MLSIDQVVTLEQRETVVDLFREFLIWNKEELLRNYGIEWDYQETLEHDRATLDQFMPPSGRLLLATVDGVPVGTASMRVHTDGAAELKRMYVRPSQRNAGIGVALVTRIIEEARHDGRRLLRLDSAGYMPAAHRLYRRMGFLDTEPYAESENSEEGELLKYWVFMALPLDLQAR